MDVLEHVVVGCSDGTGEILYESKYSAPCEFLSRLIPINNEVIMIFVKFLGSNEFAIEVPYFEETYSSLHEYLLQIAIERRIEQLEVYLELFMTAVDHYFESLYPEPYDWFDDHAYM